MIINSKLRFLTSLAVFSAIIVVSYNNKANDAPKSLRSADPAAEGPLSLGFYDGARRLSSIEEMDEKTKKYMRERLMTAIKHTWPHCVNAKPKLTAVECKEYIDDVSCLLCLPSACTCVAISCLPLVLFWYTVWATQSN